MEAKGDHKETETTPTDQNNCEESQAAEQQVAADEALAQGVHNEELANRPVMMVGIDNSETSFYCLEWALGHFVTPCAPNFPFKLILVHAKPSPTSASGLSGTGAAVLAYVDVDVQKVADRVVEKAKQLCLSKGLYDFEVEVIEGDARNVLCEAVDTYHVSMLVVGSHGYGAIKRAVLGSVSDYCAHHAHCTSRLPRSPHTNTSELFSDLVLHVHHYFSSWIDVRV